jgi:putative transposase
MVKDVKDTQLRLRIYRSAFSSMKNAIIEKAREFGVPVALVNPPHTSTICPVHGSKIIYQPDGAVSVFIIICSTHVHWFLRSLNAMRYAESHEISKYERR